MLCPLVFAAAVILQEPKAPAFKDLKPSYPQGPPADTFVPDPAWKPLDKTGALFFDPRDRRVILRARVCLREGFLEHLLCAEMSKEHESVLATKANARAIHAGLLLAKATPGHPVRYRPKFEPPTGTPIAITLEWEEKGEKKTLDGKQFVLDAKTKKTLDTDWVFAGSEQFPDPEDEKKILYAAEHAGDLFTVANFAASILDVPFASSGNDAERNFVANTEKIPPKNTYISMILRPIPAKEPEKR